MKLAVIIPAQLLIKSNHFGLAYHMLLPQYCLDPLYAGYYRTRALLGHHIIMDNGAAEFGESLDFVEVVETAELIGADEIVMPDCLGDGARTMRLTYDALAFVPERNRMMVPQGKSWSEWADCLTQQIGWGCRSIGIPKLYEGYEGGRVRALKYIITKGWQRDHEVHLLGCYENPVAEITSALITAPWIRGIDTGAPIAHAAEGVPMDHDKHVSLNWNTQLNKHVMRQYIEELLQVCSGGHRCMLL